MLNIWKYDDYYYYFNILYFFVLFFLERMKSIAIEWVWGAPIVS